MLKQKKLSPTLIKYVFNTSWLTLEKLIRIMLSFFISAYVARHLGPEKFGWISYVSAFVLPFTPIMTLVLDNILVKEFVEKKFSLAEIFGTSLFLRIIGTFISLGLIFLWTHYLLDEDEMIKKLMIIYALSSSFRIFNILEFKWQADVKAKYIAIVQFLSILVSSFAKLMAIYGEASLEGFIYAYGVEFISLALFYSVGLLKLRNSLFPISVNFSFARKMGKESLPLIFAHILIYLNMRVDQLMLKEFLGIESLGQYSIAAKLSEVLYFIPMVIQASIYPFMLQKYHQSKISYEHFLKVAIFALFWGHFFIGIIILFIGNWFILAVFGEQYNLAYQAFVIHIFSGCLISIHVMLSQRYVIEERNDKSLWANLGAILTNVLCNYLLIPILGIKGAAISVLLSGLMTFVTVGIFLDRSVLRIAFTAPFYLKWRDHF